MRPGILCHDCIEYSHVEVARGVDARMSLQRATHREECRVLRLTGSTIGKMCLHRYSLRWRHFLIGIFLFDRLAHVGVHPQKQDGLFYVGVVLPVGKIEAAQMMALANLSEQYGSGTIRLTAWQNLLISDVLEENVEALKAELEDIGLHWSATNVRAGLVACTGNFGCKFALAATKTTAMEIAQYVEDRLQLDTPLNIHVTGCPNSCAQHYIGDVGLLGVKVEVGDDLVDGYHIFVGGGFV